MTKALLSRQPVVSLDWDQTDLYRFFAFAFGPPTEERHRWFSQAGASEALASLWSELSEEDFSGFEWFRDYQSYEAAYIALFDVGSPEPPVPLFESAHNKSRPAQELALENTYFYDVFGLRADPAVSVPDHLLTQLEFLSAVAYARDQAREEPQKQEMARLEHDFLERHLLVWTGAAEEKLENCPFVAFEILFSLMTRQLRRRHQLSAAETRLTHRALEISPRY